MQAEVDGDGDDDDDNDNLYNNTFLPSRFKYTHSNTPKVCGIKILIPDLSLKKMKLRNLTCQSHSASK